MKGEGNMANEHQIPKEIEEIIEIAEKEGFLRIKGNKVEYIAQGKSYKITDPEEWVRVAFYLELVKKYQYPKERIDLEVSVKGEKRPAADIVVYEDDEKKRPYIVAECKKDGISQAEIKQAIEEGIPNAHYLKSKYAIVIAGNVRIAFDIANFPPQEREKNIIADIPVRYGKVVKYVYKKDGPKDKDDPSKELKEVNRDELLAKFQQCHDTLWEGGKRNPAEAFDEMSKLMYCKIQDERFLTQKGEYYRFQVGTYETINEVAERIRKIYKDAQEIDPEVFVESIKADNPIIYTVAEILQGISLARTDLDVKGEGYEHFLGGVFRGAMGQYFTPRPIVSFMVDFLEPSINDFVIDPACGSGGFLIYALEKVRKELHEKLEEKDASDRWKDFALKQVYGIEINNQLARVSMMNMIIHEDGHTNIENADALDNPETWKRQKIREYFGKKFTLLLTNPPFGADIKEREKPYLADYELGGKIKKRNRQKTEILFIERCLDFLKPGGRMGIVLPDGILTNSSLQYVRDFITERAQILGVVSLPQTAFRKPSSKGSGDTGSGVKASLLFLRKKKEGEKLPDNYPIFMSIAGHIGYDATGRPDKDEFPDILRAWQQFGKTNRIDFFVSAPLCFAIGRGEVENRFAPFYYEPQFRSLSERLKKGKFPLLELGKFSTFSKETWKKSKWQEDEFRYIEISHIDTASAHIAEVEELDVKKAPSRAQMLLHAHDILVSTTRPYRGAIATVPQELDNSIGSTGFAIIRDVSENINRDYLLAILHSNIGLKQMEQRMTGGNYPAITQEELKKIQIPVPPLSIQDEIADIMDQAYRLKKEKEAEAEKLLNSIEPYVLEELGIEIPETIEEKSPNVYSVTADVLKGGRLDPFHYLPEFMLTEQALDKCKYPLKTVGDILSDPIVNGLDARKFVEAGTKYLRVGNIKPGEIDETGIKFLDILLEKVEKDIRLEPNDVLLTRKGTFGSSAVVEGTTNYIISSEIMRLRLKEAVNPFYFSIINNTSLIQEQYKQKAVGAIMGSISQEAVKTVKIPLPPLPVQQIIANEFQERRERARKLEEEANEILAKAKEKVAKMILGEDDA
jgi:type I restriction enzyme M protein